MLIIAGIFFHLIGGAVSGSFYIPFKNVKGWSWGSYWIIGNLFSWLVVPPLAAWNDFTGFSVIIQRDNLLYDPANDRMVSRFILSFNLSE